MDVQNAIENVSALVKNMAENNEKIKAGLEASVNATGVELKSVKADLEGLVGKVAAQAEELREYQVKAQEALANKAQGAETLGMIVAKSASYADFAAGRTSRMRVEANTITGQSGSPATNSDVLVPAQRLPGIVPGAFRALTVLDIISRGTTTSNMVEFSKELAFTNNAAETAEGAQKPESNLTFELGQAPVVTIPTFLKVSRQVLEDSAALQSYIDARLNHAVRLRLQNQIVAGNGTGQNLGGMLKSGNHTVYTPVTGDNELDTLSRMIEKVKLADYEPTAIMMNTASWGKIQRIKKGTGDISYVFGDPAAVNGYAAQTLWGLPVVTSNSITTGKFLVGDFNQAYMLFERSGVAVEMFEQDADNVQKNLLTVRAELRAAFASMVPGAVQAGNTIV